MKRKNLILAVLLLIVAGGAIGMYFWNKKAGTVTNNADFTIQPSELIKEFDANEKAANAKYIGKGIKFSGLVSEVIGDSSTGLLLSGGEGIEIKCTFDKSQSEKVKAIVQNDSVELICECSGYIKPDNAESMLSTKSLEMVRCNLVKMTKGKVDLGTQVEIEQKDTTNKKK